MLCNIDSFLIEDARRILIFLCFAPRLLIVQKLIDGIAVDIKNSAGFNRNCRLIGVDDIREIYPALIDTGLGTNQIIKTQRRELTVIIRIAHFSVQEFLESERIRDQRCAIFGLTSVKAHTEISQICLIYLLKPNLSSSKLSPIILEDYLLAHFAAIYWYHHYKISGCCDSKTEAIIMNLFRRHKDTFSTWVRLHKMDESWDRSIDFDIASDKIASPIYYALFLGLNYIVRELVNSGHQGSAPISALSLTCMLEAKKRINT